MPTGYTYLINDKPDLTFKEFALTCTRAFGACLDQRDDPMDVKPKKKELDVSYHTDSIAEIKKRKPPTKAEFNKYVYKKITDTYKSIQEKKDLKSRYESMLAKVNNWNIPSSDHDGLKKFMISQIESSIEFDCSTNYEEERLKSIKELTYSQYKKDIKESDVNGLKYHTEKIEEEIKSVKLANDWIDKLYKSL